MNANVDLNLGGESVDAAAMIGVILPGLAGVGADIGVTLPGGDADGPVNRDDGAGGPGGNGGAGGNGAGGAGGNGGGGAGGFIIINGGAGGAAGAGAAGAAGAGGAGAGMMGPNAADLVAMGMPANGEVCFFQGAYFTGDAFCVPSGAYSIGLQGGWDDAIASIWVAEGAMVQICTDAELSDKCELVGVSVPQLFGSWLDGVSSFVVL